MEDSRFPALGSRGSEFAAYAMDKFIRDSCSCSTLEDLIRRRATTVKTSQGELPATEEVGDSFQRVFGFDKTTIARMYLKREVSSEHDVADKLKAIEGIASGSRCFETRMFVAPAVIQLTAVAIVAQLGKLRSCWLAAKVRDHGKCDRCSLERNAGRTWPFVLDRSGYESTIVTIYLCNDCMTQLSRFQAKVCLGGAIIVSTIGLAGLIISGIALNWPAQIIGIGVSALLFGFGGLLASMQVAQLLGKAPLAQIQHSTITGRFKKEIERRFGLAVPDERGQVPSYRLATFEDFVSSKLA